MNKWADVQIGESAHLSIKNNHTFCHIFKKWGKNSQKKAKMYQNVPNKKHIFPCFPILSFVAF